MTILDILKTDYQNFPENQTYSLYAEDVYFKDPLTEFQGVQRYQAMINTMKQWLKNMRLDLHHMERQDNQIHTQWTLTWTTPVPWQPRISISGRSELLLNDEEKIISHIDYWNCSRWDVVRQHFQVK